MTRLPTCETHHTVPIPSDGSLPSDRCHPCRLTDTVRVPHHIGRINRIRTRFTNPTNRWVSMALPDALSIYHVSYWGLLRDTIPRCMNSTLSCRLTYRITLSERVDTLSTGAKMVESVNTPQSSANQPIFTPTYG